MLEQLKNGLVAQLGAHHIRIVGVVGSNPIRSTMSPRTLHSSRRLFLHRTENESINSTLMYKKFRMLLHSEFFAFRCSIAIYTKNLCLYAEKYPPMGLVEEGNADIMNTNAPDPMQPDQGLVTPKSTKIRQTK